MILSHPDGRNFRLKATPIAFGTTSPAIVVCLERSDAPNVAEPTLSGLAEGLPASAWSAGTLDLDGVLRGLLGATGAAAAEIFLASPEGESLTLAAQAGNAVRAFRERMQFAPGEGFPGIVAATGRHLMSHDLETDERYLRQAVVRKGFRSYLCVPLWGKAFIGTLNLAFRRRDIDLAALLPLLAGSAEKLGLAIELERLRVADRVRRFALDPFSSPRANFEAAAAAVLDTLISAGAADGGMLLVPEGADHVASSKAREGRSAGAGHGAWTIAAERNLPGAASRTVSTGIPVTGCPAWVTGSCQAQGRGLDRANPICRDVGRGLASMVCLPLAPRAHALPDRAGCARRARPAAVVVLGYDHPLALPWAPLAFLHEALHAAFDVLLAAWCLLSAAGGAGGAGGAPVGGRAGEVPRGAISEGARGVTAGMSHAPHRGPPDGNATEIDIRCLGPFRLLIGTAVVPPEAFRRRHSVTLLKALLLREGLPVHRDELVELLWPGTDPERARSSFATALHYLRRAVCRPGGEPILLLQRVGDLFFFDRSIVHRLDLREFRDEAAAGDHLARQGQRVEALAAYERAASLYAGPLFQDDRAGGWFELERSSFEDLHLQVLRGAARLHQEAGDLDAAIEGYRRALRCEPALEDLHVALMQSLSEAGRRTEALRQFEELCAVLDREFDTTPLPDTQKLYNELTLET